MFTLAHILRSGRVSELQVVTNTARVSERVCQGVGRQRVFSSKIDIGCSKKIQDSYIHPLQSAFEKIEDGNKRKMTREESNCFSSFLENIENLKHSGCVSPRDYGFLEQYLKMKCHRVYQEVVFELFRKKFEVSDYRLFIYPGGEDDPDDFSHPLERAFQKIEKDTPEMMTELEMKNFKLFLKNLQDPTCMFPVNEYNFRFLVNCLKKQYRREYYEVIFTLFKNINKSMVIEVGVIPTPI